MGIHCDSKYLIANQTDAKVLFRNAGHFLANSTIRWYNCGGFALGYGYWYLPYNNDFEDELYQLEEDYNKGYIDSQSEFVNSRARIMVDYMVRYENCREIHYESELEDDEYLVLFKASYDDFHYVRRMDNGEWYHKMGGSDIQKITEEDVYSDEWWENLPLCYDSEIYMLAVKKRDIAKERIQRKLDRKMRGRHNG